MAFRLLEDGSFRLLEDGVSRRLLEGSDVEPPIEPPSPPILEYNEDYFRRYMGDKELTDIYVARPNTDTTVSEEDDYFRRYLGDKL